jgi:hypothetical protein
MASIYRRKDSKYFWINYKDKNGMVHQESTRFRIGVAPEIRLARALEAKRTYEELQFGFARKADEGWAWVPDYIKLRATPASYERYVSGWKSITLFLEEKEIDCPAKLTRKHCCDYVFWRQKPDKSKGKYKAGLNTALLELKALRVIMNEAVVREMCSGNPCVKLEIKRAEPHKAPGLTEEDCAKIRAAIQEVKDPERKTFLSNSFEIARYQGCRLSETRVNPQTDVNLVGGVWGITFKIKGGREHTTVLHPNLVPLFARMKAEGFTETWHIPEHVSDNSRRQWPASIWWKFLKKIGLKAKGVTFRSTRITVVTELALNNVHISKAKRYVGHANESIHEGYQRIIPKDLGDCTDAVGD